MADLKYLSTKLSAKSKLELLSVVFLSSTDRASSPSSGVQLLGLINSLAKFQLSNGAKGASKETERFVQEVQSSDVRNVDVRAFADAVSEFDAVNAFVRKIESCSGDREKFNRVMDRLSSKGIVTKTQLSDIAFRYVGGQRRYKTADLAIEAIRGKFASELLFTSKTAKR